MSPDLLLMLPTLGHRLPQAKLALEHARRCARRPFRTLAIVDDSTATEVTAGLSITMDVDVDISPVRRGCAAAFSAGITHFLKSDFPFLGILEDGIQVCPAWDEWLRQVLVAHPDMGWVAALQPNPGTTFTSMASMMNRAAAEALAANPGGAFDQEFAPYHYEDSDAVMRLRAAGFLPHGIPIQVQHPETMTGAEDRSQHYVLGLAQRKKFTKRWDRGDFDWWSVPRHYSCSRCGIP